MKKKIMLMALFLMSILCYGDIVSASGMTYTEGDFIIYVTTNIMGDEEVSIVSCTSQGESVTIPEKLHGDYSVYIQRGAFSKCKNLKNIYSNNSAYESIDGVLYKRYNDSEIELVAYPIGRTEEEYEIGENVLEIASGVFKGCQYLKNIKVNPSNPYFKSLDGVLYEEYYVSDSEGVSHQKYFLVAYPEGKKSNTYEIQENTKSIRSDAFSNSFLENLIMPEGIICGKESFSDCTNLKKVYYQGTMKSWCEISGEYLARELNKFEIYINNRMLKGEIVINEDIDFIADAAFYGIGDITKLVINTKKGGYIGDEAFYNCTDLKNVEIGDNVLRLGKGCFSNCETLQSIGLCDGLKYINERAFYECESIEKMIIPDSVVLIGDRSMPCKIKELTMPVSAKYNLEYKEIKQEVDWSYYYVYRYPAFQGCTNIEKITLTSGNGEMQTYDEYPYGTPWYLSKGSLKEIVLEEGITNIKSYMFANLSSDIKLILPSSIKIIENKAFDQIECADDEIVSSGGWLIKVGCKLGNIDLTKYKKIVSQAFKNCESFVTITIPDNIDFLGSNVFENCSLLSEVTIPAGVRSIGSNVFDNCPSLLNVYYNDSAVAWNEINLDNTNNIELGSKLHFLFVKDGYEATCTEPGLSEGKYYTNSDRVLQEQIQIPAKGHNWSEKVEQINGQTYKICTVCGNKMNTLDIEKFKKNQTITAKSLVKEYSNSVSKLKVTTSGNGKITYQISDNKIINISSDGKLKIKGYGKVVVTIIASETNEYKLATKKITILIKPQKAKLSKVKSPKKETMKISWKKDRLVTGYQVQFSTNKKFKKGLRQRYFNKNQKSITVPLKKKSGKKYYVRIRSYKRMSGVDYYSKWSKVKKVTIK